MLRVLKLRSPMSVGSWILSLFGVVCSLSAAVQVATDLSGRRVFPRVARVASIAGLPFSLLLAGYTGVLLEATNVPLWVRFFPFLGPTFVSSAFSSSLAALSIAIGDEKKHRKTHARLDAAETACLALETLVMCTGLLRLGKLGRPLTRGKWALIFWPATFVGGLLVPLCMRVNAIRTTRSLTGRQRRVSSLLTLVGGYSLRAVIVFAGRESARRPEDYFELTRRSDTGSR